MIPEYIALQDQIEVQLFTTKLVAMILQGQQNAPRKDDQFTFTS